MIVSAVVFPFHGQEGGREINNCTYEATYLKPYTLVLQRSTMQWRYFIYYHKQSVYSNIKLNECRFFTMWDRSFWLESNKTRFRSRTSRPFKSGDKFDKFWQVYIKIVRQSNSVEQRGDYLIKCLFSENYRNDILKWTDNGRKWWSPDS